MAKKNSADKPMSTTHLASQKIDENGPGTILRDFETLLNFVDGGVRSTGKYHLLPMARLGELDELMTRPLRPRLKRPQQSAFPHINGMYLLLRASQLAVPEGLGKTTGRLTLDPGLHEQWKQLNPTERYFNLVEAWLLRATWQAIESSNRGFPGDVGVKSANIRQWFRAARADASRAYANPSWIGWNVREQTGLALLELFGVMSVQRDEPHEGKNWNITRIDNTPFGDELLTFLSARIMDTDFGGTGDSQKFGVWQKSLRPYFPEWVNNLIIPPVELREGIYYFKVSLGNTWRRIAIPGDFEVDALAWAIIDAYKFDGDHLYCFHLKARDGRSIVIGRPEMDDADEDTDDMAIGELPLDVKQSMKFEYDFGADWRFEVTLEKIEPDDPTMSEPNVVKSHGKAPKEYRQDY